MSTMTVPLTDTLQGFVDEQVARRGLGDQSDYVLELLQREHDRERLRALILEGVNSPLDCPADAAYFESLRTSIRER
jgi:antitoxin ParD1/3/4